MRNELNIPQSLMLLALRDDKGSIKGDFFPQALAGATVTELLLAKLLVQDEDKADKYICIADDIDRGSYINSVAAYLQKDGRSRTLKSWTERLALKSSFIKMLAEELCAIGAVTQKKSKILGMFPVTKWPEANHIFEKQILDQITLALGSQTPVNEIDDKIGLITVLADAGGFLSHNIDSDLYNSSKKRLTELKKFEFLNSDAFIKVIKETEAAVFLTIFAAAIIPVVTAS